MKYAVVITSRGPDGEVDSKRVSVVESDDDLNLLLSLYEEGYSGYTSCNVIGPIVPLPSWTQKKMLAAKPSGERGSDEREDRRAVEEVRS